MKDNELAELIANLKIENYKLKEENQQLKQKYEMQKDSNKLLCKAITCDDCDCKVCEAHIQNIKYKSVLDEIREYIEHKSLYEEEYDYDYEENMYLSGISDEKAKEDILQILDKVKVGDSNNNN